MNFYFGYNQPLSGGILHYYLYRYSSRYGLFEEEDWEIPDDLFEEEDIKAAQDVPLFAQYYLGWITEDEFELRKEMLRRTLGITVSQEMMDEWQEHHSNKRWIARRDQLVDEILPELQKHPKVQAEWSELSKAEMLQMPIVQLEEMRRYYQQTIEEEGM